MPDGYEYIDETPKASGGYAYIDAPAPEPVQKPTRTPSVSPAKDGRGAILSLFPSAYVTDWKRDPNSNLGRANTTSFHNRRDSAGAVDIRRIPGMSFNDYVSKIREAGYPIIEARDEYANPSPHATGPHWHVTIGEREGSAPAATEAPQGASTGGYEYVEDTPPPEPFVPKMNRPASEAPFPIKDTDVTQWDPSSGKGVPEGHSILTEYEQTSRDYFTGSLDRLMMAPKGKRPTKKQFIADARKNAPAVVSDDALLGYAYDEYAAGRPYIITWNSRKREDPNVPKNPLEGLPFAEKFQEEVIAPLIPEQPPYNGPVASAPPALTPGEVLQKKFTETLDPSGAGINAGFLRGLINMTSSEEDKAKLLDKWQERRQGQEQFWNDQGERTENPVMDEVAKFAGETGGSVTPLDILGPGIGKTALGRVLGAGGANAAEDVASQTLEGTQGLREQYDPLQTVTAAAGGAALQGAVFEPLGMIIKRYAGKSLATETFDNPKVVGVDEPATPSTTPRGKVNKKQASVAAEVAKATEGWVDSPEIVVHGSKGSFTKAEPELAEKLRQDKADNRASGFYGEDGRIHVLAYNVKDVSNVKSLVFHEALGHAGLAKSLGGELDNILNDLYTRNPTLRREADALGAGPYKDIYTGDDALARLTEEVLAKRSEAGVISTGIIDRFRAAISPYVRKLGLTMDLSNAEVKAILADAHAMITKGGKAADGANTSGLKYMRVYHGSGADFDKFDNKKIGTGEGAQVYGHGLYFTETRSIADQYKQKLGGSPPYNSPKALAIQELNNANGDTGKAVARFEALKKEVQDFYPDSQNDLVPQFDEAIRILQRGETGEGKLYEVDLPDDMKWLAWDFQPEEVDKAALKKLGIEYGSREEIRGLYDDYYLSQQKMMDAEDTLQELKDSGKQFEVGTSDTDKSFGRGLTPEYQNVQAKLRDAETSVMFLQHEIDNASPSGDILYKKLVDKLGSAEKASKALEDVGFDGVKYLDGNSRDVGEGTYNYVVFDDKKPKIINKYMLEDDLPQRTVKKFMTAMKGARILQKKYEADVKADAKEKLNALRKARGSSSGEAGLYTELAALKGKTTKPVIEPFREKFSQKEAKALFDLFKNDKKYQWFESLNARIALKKLFDGEVPTKGELDLLARVLPKDFIKYALQMRTVKQKLGDAFIEGVNIPRALMASVDLSAPFRQGLFLVSRGAFWKNFPSMFRHAWSQEFHDAQMAEIRGRDSYPLMQKANLALTEMGVDAHLREEDFMATTPEKWVGIGRLVKGSNRAYTGFLNQLRADVFDDIVKTGMRKGVDFNSDVKALRSLGGYINDATGRASLGKTLDKHAPLLNAVFFSARLIASRVKLLTNVANPMWYAKTHPLVRAQYFRDLIGFGSIAVSLAALADFGGADVEWDPRSSDFLKIRVGKTRYDIFGGFSQYLTLGARLSPEIVGGNHTKTLKGEVKKLNDGPYGPGTRGDVTARFLRNKLAPVPSYVADFLFEKNPVGDEFHPGKDALKRVVPLFIQDLKKGYDEEGYPGLAKALPSGLGIGSSTYDQIPAKYDPLGRDPESVKDGDPVSTELDRLSKLNEDERPVIGWVTKSNLPKGPVRDAADPKDIEALQKLSGDYIYADLKQEMASPEWDKLTDEEKVELVNKIERDQRKNAREDLFPEAETETEKLAPWTYE